jgi:hypothetical protein
MSRKDYEKFAQMIKKDADEAHATKNPSLRSEMLRSVHNTAQTCIDVFTEDNPLFNKARFLQACGLGE